MIKRILLTSSVLFSLSNTNGQGLIVNGATISLNNTPYIHVEGTDGNITLEDDGANKGAFAITTGGNVSLDGDWANNGTASPEITTTVGEFVFSGSTAQAIGGSATTDFPTLTMDNSSGKTTGVTLNEPTNVHQTLTLTNGVIQSTAINYLRMEDNSSTSLGDGFTFVDGPIRYAMGLSGTRTLNLPIGKDTNWRPLELTVEHSAATEYFYTAELINDDSQQLFFTKPGTIHHTSYVHYYTVTRNSTANYTDGQIRIHYKDTAGIDDDVIDVNDVGVVKDDGSSNWVDICNTPGTAIDNGSVLSAVFTPQDTYFALASKTGINPLPVWLLDFSEQCAQGMVELTWSTAQELNNSHFLINKSLDGANYTNIGTVTGAGTSNSKIDYSFIDSNYANVGAYYELIQVDYNGAETKYGPIVGKCFPTDPGASNVKLFPNPATDRVGVYFNGLEGNEVNLSITNMLGQQLFNQVLTIGNNTYLYQTHKTEFLPTGTYIVTARNNTTSGEILLNEKLIVR